MSSPFLEYIRNGWALTPLADGEKNPRQFGWQKKTLALTEPEEVEGLQHAGLCHAYSGTCAIDIDDARQSQEYLEQFGIDLKALYNAPNAVRILSGRKNRAKLLYSLPDPLPSYKVITEVDGVKTNIIDFRCGTREGMTVQDALPPSRHPKTGKPYYWNYADELIGDWSVPPPIPAELLEFWQQRLHERDDQKEKVSVEYDAEELEHLLLSIDADEDYNTWLHVGMAIHDATGGSDEGLDVWDRWSSSGEKYKGIKDLIPHWRSFRGSGITSDFLLMHQVAQPNDFEIITGDEEDEEQPAKKSEKFLPIRVDEWVTRPPPKWLVHDVLPESDLAMVFGQSGSGKSFFLMEMALVISSGMEWRERITNNGPVLWVAAEAAGSVRNRALAHAQHNRMELTEADFWIIGDTPDLNSVDHVRAIGKAAKKIDPVMIVIDTMNAASGGANENSGEDMAVILAACRALHKISNALVLLIHHSGKDQTKGARGWSGIKGAMQTEIEITHEETGERQAKIVKQRDGEQDIEFPFRLVPISLLDYEGVAQTSCAVEPVEGVMLADVALHPGWASAAFYEFVLRGAETISKQTFIESVVHRAGSAGADSQDLEDGTDMLLDHIADTGHYTTSQKDVSLVGDFEDAEEFL